MTKLELTEYIPRQYPDNAVPSEVGLDLWNRYSSQVLVEFPNPKTDGQWQFTSQGWVGYIPLSSEAAVALRPRVEIANIFRMLEYAYRLKSFNLLEGLFDCETLEEFYERLAHILCLRTLDRGRKGFYRDYLLRSERLPYVRGRLNIPHLIKTWEMRKKCNYHEHTADLEDNQILAWTFLKITRSGLCGEQVLPFVRKAYRELIKSVIVKPFTFKACLGRLYNRLNVDYEPLHVLCRFFLENTGPTHELGDKSMLPFLVNMERLFELFVAEWFRAHLPEAFFLLPQEKVSITEDNSLHFDIDLVLYDASSGDPICVLDTKYKTAQGPASSDIAQVVAYASAKKCSKAILIYPSPLLEAQKAEVGDVQIRCLTFGLDGDLEDSGKKLLQDVIND